ncbi:ABC transporter permease [Frankia sp. AgPm24]|uniref:ABC transporter permease n=1 Tax=Frankia sp. AgPm24 TaxID=631128 RepID=UPI00200D7C57|nr:ABC transporter permease subunit [Frankia sp. AgPm24]
MVPVKARAPRSDLLLGLLIIAPPVLATLVGGLVRPYSATASVGPPLAGPSAAHLLGTDTLGRDVLSRLLLGGRGLLLVTLLAVLAAQVFAVLFGVLAGWLGRYGARALLGLLDVVLAVPAVVVLATAASAVGAGGAAVFVAIVVVLVPTTARVVYVSTRTLVAEPFVEAAVLCGTPTRRILTRELLPNLWTIIVAGTGSRVVESVFVISAAGFLGFGPQPPSPDWGQMISENSAGVALAPWSVLAPALAITMLAIGVTLLSDACVARLDQTTRADRPARSAHADTDRADRA